MGKNGPVLRSNTANAITIFTHDPAWNGVLAYDEFADTIVSRKIPPWRKHEHDARPRAGDWTDEDTTRAQSWLSAAHGIDVGPDATLAALKVVSLRARIHPVRDWLQSLRWDGTKRAREWLVKVMGCDDTPYVQEVGQSFLVAAVARVFVPGCKVDTVPIFEGEQGTFKSSTIRALAGDEWFLEMSVTDITSKDAMQVLRRKWIAELPEIDGLSKSEAAHVKGFFSRQVDTYRPSYGRMSRDFLRQVVFLGSTNKQQYLFDETGARRFHPVRCRMGNLTLVRELREQLWAEAVALYESGVVWHVTDPQLAEAFAEEQGARHRPHPWEETVAQWLDSPLQVGKPRREGGVTTSDVLQGALALDVEKRTQGHANIVAGILRRLGWQQGKQSRRNGVQVRLFFPTTEAPRRAEEHGPESPSGVVPVAPVANGPWIDEDDDGRQGSM